MVVVGGGTNAFRLVVNLNDGVVCGLRVVVTVAFLSLPLVFLKFHGHFQIWLSWYFIISATFAKFR